MRLLLLLLLVMPAAVYAQLPPIDPGVSQELAKWRSVQYSNISYKLDLTLEKMSPVLRGQMEIRVTQAASACAEPNCPPLALILDWRKLPGHEKDSTLSNVRLNDAAMSVSPLLARGLPQSGAQLGSEVAEARASARAIAGTPTYEERDDHLIFHDGVKMGENVITLDFTSPILTSGSAITRYIDKEDGSEYIYSLFVPSDASTAFPVFDQPDLKAKFTLSTHVPVDWKVISNDLSVSATDGRTLSTNFYETKPISTYVFAFTAGPWKEFSEVCWRGGALNGNVGAQGKTPSDSQNALGRANTARGSTDPELKALLGAPTRQQPCYGLTGFVGGAPPPPEIKYYVRASQAKKFEPHAKEVFHLTREGIDYLETYFDYKFPWPKYDLVLIPEFPFGGMEHAGATFLKESSVIFPTEPTKGDEISRANVIFHETAHQWFGDLVTMRWFDDLWLKEGFAEFMAYKTLEHVMPDANAWKVFYERNKQAAYATDSTKGTTPIYQPIANLSAAKSAYGNIVYRKAPSFLRQAEFYLGEDKFQTAVRAFLKKHEYANAGWEDLVGEFGQAEYGDEISNVYKKADLEDWAKAWVTQPGAPVFSQRISMDDQEQMRLVPWTLGREGTATTWPQKTKLLSLVSWGRDTQDVLLPRPKASPGIAIDNNSPFSFLNYGDYGYGIFLLDDKSRDYVLKHIGEEKDPFLRSMMWGALWDSVREAELDPREYVELVIRQLGGKPEQRGNQIAEARASARAVAKDGTIETDETTIQSLLGRVSVALNYYLPTSDIALAHARASATSDLRSPFEATLLDRMQHAETPGLRVTFYRAFVSNASTEHGRAVLKAMLAQASGSQKNHPVGGTPPPLLRKEGSPVAGVSTTPPAKAGTSRNQGGEPQKMALRTKDKFDIVTRLIVLGDPDAARLLAELEKTETSDDAKRYAYAAHAAFATAENRAKFWNDFVNNKDISESWIEAAIGPFNSIRHPELSQPYLARALAELPNLKRTRKIFFVNNWLGAWLGGQRDQAVLDIVNKFLADNPKLDNDLRLKVLENVDIIERAVKIRRKFSHE